MQTTKREIINQIAFCQELMNRLFDDCMKNLEFHTQDDNFKYYSVYKGTQMAQDSIRLRRELNKFNKMIIYNGG